MIEFIELLEHKFNTNDEALIEKINEHLIGEYGIAITARGEAGSFIQATIDGFYPKEKVYDFLYKFIDFYYEDAEYIYDFANNIMLAVSNDWIDPIDGSRLIGAIWSVLGYPVELTEFIGMEGEVENLDNRLRSKDISESEKIDIKEKLGNIRQELIKMARLYIENNTI